MTAVRKRRRYYRWLALGRVARRDMTSQRVRTALVVAMVAIPMVICLWATAVLRAETGTFGTINFSGYVTQEIYSLSDPSQAAVAAEQADELAGPGNTVAVVTYSNGAVLDDDGTPVYGLSFSDLDLDDPLIAENTKILQGRPPTEGEIALTPESAVALDVDVGDELVLQRPSGQWTVSALVEFGPYMPWPAAVAPGFDMERVRPENASTAVLASLTEPPDDTDPAYTYYGDGYGSTSGGTAAFFVGMLMIFMAFAVIIVVAFATGSRRQLVAAGKLSVAGAPRASIAVTMGIQGALTAAVGVLVGLGLVGLVGGLASPVSLQRWLWVSTLTLRPFDVAALAAMATLVATGAAALPGWSLSRVPALMALAGRSPIRVATRRIVVGGAVVFGLGLLLIRVGTPGGYLDAPGEYLAEAMAALGVLAVGLGMCSVGPFALTLLDRWSSRFPLSLRMATRSRRRNVVASSAVIAAVAVTASVTLVAVQEQTRILDESGQVAGDVADNAVVLQVYLDPVVATGSGEMRLSQATNFGEVQDMSAFEIVDEAAERARTEQLVDAATAELLRIVPEAVVTPVRVAGPTWLDSWTVVADPATLDAYGWTETGRAALDRYGFVQPVNETVDVYWPEADDVDPLFDPTPVEGATTIGWPPPLITESAARERGWDINSDGAVMLAPDPLTDNQLEAISAAGAHPEGELLATIGFVEPGDPEGATSGSEVYYSQPWPQPEPARAVGALLAISTAATLVIAAIGISLTVDNERRDRAVLAVVGARPQTLRSSVAFDSLIMVGSGVLIGVISGVGIGYATSIFGGFTIHWGAVAAQVLLVPLLVMGFTWLAARILIQPRWIPVRQL